MGSTGDPLLRAAIDDEIANHLREREEALIEAGMSARQARREARRRFGSVRKLRRRLETIDGSDGLSGGRSPFAGPRDLLQDMGVAVRRLRQSPLFTVAVLLTLGLGIGVNTAVFTLVNGVVLRPIPYVEPDRLVALHMVKTDDSAVESFSLADYTDLRAESEAFTDVGFWTWWSMDITDGDTPESVQSVRVSANMMGVIGIEPLYGRLFRPEEAEPGNDHVALVSYGLWQRRYGGDPDLVGQQIGIDGHDHTVIGVMPRGFRFPYVEEYGAGFWTPISLDPDETSRGSRWLNAVARLADDASIETARSEAETIAARWEAEFPDSNAGWSIAARSMHESVVGSRTGTALWVLYGVVAFVLLIACANLANLLMARMESRQREIAVRAALGAGRARILRELLTETAVLAFGGGILGFLFALWGMDTLLTLVPSDIPRLDEIRVDGTVLGFAIMLSFLTSLLFGVLPAAQTSRRDLHDVLKASTARSGGSTRHRFRGALVVVEVALALVLLVGAGLLLRSFSLLTGEEAGFDLDRVLTFQVSPSNSYPEAGPRYGFYRDLSQSLAAVPEVDVVGANTSPPLSGVNWATNFTLASGSAPPPGQAPTAQFNTVTPEFFRTLRIPLVRGRFLTEDDVSGRERVVLVNETLVERHWPDGDAVGELITIGNRGDYRLETMQELPTFEIVGVVGDTRKFGLDSAPAPELYISYAQSPPHFMNFVLRTRGNPLTIADAVRARVWEINDQVAVEDLTTMALQLDASLAEPRFNMLLLGSFAALALILAMLGIYGVISYATAERTREIGVRMALGAQAGDVFRMMVGHGLLLTGIGLLIGVAVSLAMTRLVAGMLYEVTATDPITFAVVAVLVTAVAFLAAYLPARRATRVDPLVALRNQ